MNFLKSLFCSLVFLSLLACKKENPNPELLDPIYKDLVSQHKEYEKLLKDELKALEQLEKDLIKAPPRSLERKVSLKDIKKSKAKILDYSQKIKYYEIRAERRRVEGRRAYKISFQQDKSWPDPEEYKYYKIHEKLRNAPLNWSYRVPKLYKDNPNFKDPSEYAKAEK